MPEAKTPEAKGPDAGTPNTGTPNTGTPNAGTPAAGTSRPAKPRRRQARGERRIAQLLEAAANVFCMSGYTAASTNAIAREAGVSPGTLYQFFPNKEAIAVELGDRLLNEMREAHGQAFTPANIALPLDEMLDAVLDPLIEFNCQHPAFLALMHGSDVPGRIAEEHDAVHASMLAQVEDLLGFYLPEMPADDRHRTANMAFAVFKAGLELVVAHRGAERDAYTKEVKASLYRYLDPVIGDATTTKAHLDTP